MAASVPSTRAIATAASAARIEVTNACGMVGLSSASPNQRSVKPGRRPRHEAAHVEGVDGDDDERQVQEREDEPRRDAQADADPGGLSHRRRHHSESKAPRRRAMTRYPSMIMIGTIEYAAAIGKSPSAGVVIDHVADELRVAHQARDDVVAEGQREGEDRSGHEGREDERQDDPAEGRPRLGRQGRRTPPAASRGRARGRRRSGRIMYGSQR